MEQLASQLKAFYFCFTDFGAALLLLYSRCRLLL
jgi:hypothetical protein